MNETWTVLKLLHWCRDYFAGKGIESARLDAEVLLAKVLGCDRVGLYLRFDQPLEAGELATMREWVRRRGCREPVAHLVGTREFYGLSFLCDARALVPRPETELLVETALALLPETNAALCEVGTGSGCVAVSLAKQRPAWRVTATEVSPEAADLARENIARLQVEDRVEVCEVSLLDAEAGGFDAVLSNPPYIASGDLATLMPEVAQYDPALALDGGPDGLDVIRKLVPRAREALKPAGWLVVECGAGQADAVAELFAAGGFDGVERRCDLAGIERVVIGRRS
ncbi:MAG: peptide chain release factor N(5)-glutamine methyltransferase [Candidatus Lernaella stagnicola]|nr:peptide chain release factor N(5)-glutamine methyltransferase [Candidatus Lernaella stagnicola]